MKRLLLLACLFCLGASAQNLSTFGTISAASTANTCTATSCVYYQLPSGATWVTLQITGTWSGSVGVYSITSQNATYQNLNSQTWTQQANLTANGTWAIAAGNSTFILVQSSSFSSGSANITMTASSTGSPLMNPILAGNLTVSGINQSTASTSGQCWNTQGGVASCGYGPGTVVPVVSGGTGAALLSTGTSNTSSSTATAQCSVTSAGNLLVYPNSFGSGYISAPTVTLTNVPTGATATVVANAPVNGQITSYTVTSSSGWAGSVNANGNPCPALVTVSAPPAASAPTPVISAATSGMTTFSPEIKVDDFGAKGDGVTDDRVAIQNAFNYAASLSNGINQPKVSFSANKNYYIGSIGGYYPGGSDDGTVPVAATLSCTASGGVVSGCTIINGGYDLASIYTVLAPGTTGSGASVSYTTATCTTSTCPYALGNYISSATVSGGSGYPNTFTMYLGPTCSGVPCTFLAPETPAQIGYGVSVPGNITIEGNGATILGGATGTAINTSSYSTAFPYIASFAGGGSNTVNNLNFNQAFIAWGNLGSFNSFTNIGLAGVIGFQGNSSQYNSYTNINTQCRNCRLLGPILLVGGYWEARAPWTSPETSAILNAYNLGDATTINNAASFGYVYSNSTNQKALDCWFDSNFFHLEDQGITNSLACYTPPSGVVRMTDQDLAGLPEPDAMWRGVWGTMIDIYTRYGRQTNGVTLNQIDNKQRPSYAIVIGPHTVRTSISGYGDEGTGLCEGGVEYGSASCPNPYEPFTTQLEGQIVIGESVDIKASATVQPNLLYPPWQLGNGNSSTASAQGTNFSFTTLKNSAPLPSLLNIGNPSAVVALLVPNYANQSARTGQLNGDSQSVGLVGGFSNHPDLWEMRVADSLVPWSGLPYEAAPSSLLEFRSRTTNSQYESSAVKVPGLYVDNYPTANGSVAGITITNGGSGYTPNSQVSCTMSQSTSTLYMPGTSTPYTATCYAVANAFGVVSRLKLTQPALGYLAAPTVTLGAPNTGGTQATATATLAQGVVPPDAKGREDYMPLNKLYAYVFYIPSNVVISAYSSASITGNFCPGGTIHDHATLLSNNTAFPAGVSATMSTTNGSSCTITVNNFTGSSYTLQGGTSFPYQVLLENSLLEGSNTPSWITTITPSSTTSAPLAAPTLAATTVSIGGSALTAGQCASTTVSVSGATTSMVAVTNPLTFPGAGFYWNAYVSSANTVTVSICAAVAGTPTASTYNVRVIQ